MSTPTIKRTRNHVVSRWTPAQAICLADLIAGNPPKDRRAAAKLKRLAPLLVEKAKEDPPKKKQPNPGGLNLR